jgi:hypothetical protein
MTFAMKGILIIAGLALILGFFCMIAVLIAEHRDKKHQRDFDNEV